MNPSLPGDLVVLQVGEEWRIARFDDQLKEEDLSLHPSEDDADSRAAVIATAEQVNVFKPNEDGLLALFLECRADG
jgi:hypothetical protein